MIVVYVKHYLNKAGTEYFDNEWYPYVRSIIQEQNGYSLIETSLEPTNLECRNITVKFRDDITFAAWVAHPDHQKVLSDLDKFRTKPWHYIKMEGENPIAPNDIEEWDTVTLS